MGGWHDDEEPWVVGRRSACLMMVFKDTTASLLPWYVSVIRQKAVCCAASWRR